MAKDEIYVVKNKSFTNRCDACQEFLPEGLYVAFDPTMLPGREHRHIGCVDVPPAIVAARRAIAKAELAEEKAKETQAEADLKVARDAIAQATREVLSWVWPRLLSSQERRDKLRRRLDAADAEAASLRKPPVRQEPIPIRRKAQR